MTLEIVEKEVATWAPEDQDRLAAYLTLLRLKRSPDHAQECPPQSPSPTLPRGAVEGAPSRSEGS
jgi:hypothetical protein